MARTGRPKGTTTYEDGMDRVSVQLTPKAYSWLKSHRHQIMKALDEGRVPFESEAHAKALIKIALGDPDQDDQKIAMEALNWHELKEKEKPKK